MIDKMTEALKKAKEEQSKAIYLEECGSNAGIRKMNANKCEWLKWVIYLAEIGLETEKAFTEREKSQIAEIIPEQSIEAYGRKSNFQRVLKLLQAINSTKLY